MTLGFLGKAAFLYAVGNVSMRAASFLLIPIYAYYLDQDDFGLLMMLLLTVQFMLVAMNCGTEHSIVRYAKQYEKSGQLDSLMGTSFVVSVTSTVVVACVCLTLLIPFFERVLCRQEVFVLIGLTLGSALFQSFCDMLTAYYRSQHKPLKYACVGVATALLLSVLSFAFLYILNMGVGGAMLAKVIAHGLVFSIIAWQIYSKTGFQISTKLIPKLLYFGLPLSMSSFGQFAITGASIYFLSPLAGLKSVAIYSLGNKLASVLLMVLVLPFQLGFQPYVFAQLDNPEIKKQMARSLTYLMWAVAAGSFCILFGARLLLPLIAPPEYSDAFLVTLFLMPAMGFLGLFYYGETLIKATQKSYLIGFLVTVTAVLSVILNFILVYYLSWYGALLATNVTLMFLGVSLFLIGLKGYHIPTEWYRLRVAGVLFVGVLLTNLFLIKSNLYLYTIVNLIWAGVIIYFAARSPLWNRNERYSVLRGIARFKLYFKKSNPKQIKNHLA